jgi:hypothetical protein
MDKLEQYLDQVCHSIGGPRSMRQHVRRELREHLLDAVARHEAVGSSKESALEQALEEFGRPEDVRSDLEAAHGQRMMAVVIDRAMHWKEMTMRAKWLWTTWAYIAVVLVLVLNVLFITFNVLFIIPKFQKVTHDGIVDRGFLEENGMSWMFTFLDRLMYITGHYTTQMLLLAVGAWGLLEWRVKSENKPFIRLSVLGTAAVGLTIVGALMADAMLISFCGGLPAVGKLSRPFAEQQVAAIDSATRDVEAALATKDWEKMKEQADKMLVAVNFLTGPAVLSLTWGNDSLTVAEMKEQVKTARNRVLDLQQSIDEKDADGVKSALNRFRTSFAPVQEAGKKKAK